MKEMKGMKDNKGFTLVEMAIVLVIIGIILAGVLKGEELINNAKMKRTYSLYRETMAAYYTYLDKYQRFPGDDNTVATRTGWVASVDGNNNGRIDGGVRFNCTGAEAAGEESCNALRHLRLANIIVGSGRTNPGDPYGGSVVIAYRSINGKATNWIAMSNIPADVAESIDTQNDDGIYNSGSIRGSADYTLGNPVILYFSP
ncbi:hypothetical protein BMS3Abin07_02555 [bacterium BMS3Abin07]|nr:hypothetical protein BMS3Abin07_02555 [bacterium BMS3Abin07]